jgi:hypothetical protein
VTLSGRLLGISFLRSDVQQTKKTALFLSVEANVRFSLRAVQKQITDVTGICL